jgi:hypothetical protein
MSKIFFLVKKYCLPSSESPEKVVWFDSSWLETSIAIGLKKFFAPFDFFDTVQKFLTV